MNPIHQFFQKISPGNHFSYVRDVPTYGRTDKGDTICPPIINGGGITSTNTLCAMLGVHVTAALGSRGIRWFGHVACSSSCTNSTTSMTIPSTRRGKPKKNWSKCVKTDMKMYSLGSINPLNREAWGLGVRHSSHLLPTQVPGTPAAIEK